MRVPACWLQSPRSHIISFNRCLSCLDHHPSTTTKVSTLPSTAMGRRRDAMDDVWDGAAHTEADRVHGVKHCFQDRKITTKPWNVIFSIKLGPSVPYSLTPNNLQKNTQRAIGIRTPQPLHKYCSNRLFLQFPSMLDDILITEHLLLISSYRQVNHCGSKLIDSDG